MPSVYLSPSSQEKNIGVDGVPEENRMHALAKVIAADLRKHNITVWAAKPEWTLSQIIADSNLRRPDLHVALHSNAGGGTGTETWCFRTKGTKSAEFGKKLQAAVVNVLDLPDRGIKDGAAPGQKLGEIVNVIATSVLIELFFHDNAKDVQRYKERTTLVAATVTKTIADWLGAPLQQPAPAAETKPVNLSSTASQVTIKVRDKYLTGFLIDGRSYAPVRALAEHLGKTVVWNGTERVVIISD